MAIKIDTEYRGIKVIGAHASIEPGTIALTKTNMAFCVMFRASETNEPFMSKDFSAEYSIVGENPFSQAYEYLKTLEEFFGATDC